MKTLRAIFRLIFTNRRTAAIAASMLAMAVSTPLSAQAVCDSTTAPTSSVCNGNNSLSWVMPTTNTDGSPFNDFSSVRAVFGTMSPLCSAQGVPVTGAVVRNLGALGQPPSPVPNTTVTAKLSTLNLPGGATNLTVQVVDLTGNVSSCPTPVAFTFDNGIPGAPAAIKVGP